MTPDSCDDASEPKHQNERWLREQYIDQQQTIVQVADNLDCTAEAVRYWLRQFDIDIRDPQRGPWRDETWLRTQYIDKRKSAPEIADEYDCDKETVLTWLDRHEIETRDYSERQLAKHGESRYQDEEWLRTQYVEKRRTGPDIADECEVSPVTIYNWLERYGIEVRP